MASGTHFLVELQLHNGRAAHGNKGNVARGIQAAYVIVARVFVARPQAWRARDLLKPHPQGCLRPKFSAVQIFHHPAATKSIARCPLAYITLGLQQGFSRTVETR